MSTVIRSLLLAPLFLAAGAFAQQAPPAPGTPPAQTTTPPSAGATTAGALPDSPDSNVKPAVQPTGPTAVFDTSMGQMRCVLYDQQAPLAVANFIGLATGAKDWTNPVSHKKEHHVPLYNGTTFHRVIPGFMIQGGDPAGDGTGDGGYMFSDEIVPDLTFDVPGRLAMANSGPNTNGTQFFITEQAYPSLDGSYTIFGQCDDASVSVEKSIAQVQRDSNDKPLSPVTLTRVTIVQAGQPIPAPTVPTPPSAGAPTPAGTSNPQ